MSDVKPTWSAVREKEMANVIAGMTGMCDSFADRLSESMEKLRTCTPEERAFNRTDPKMQERLMKLSAAVRRVDDLVS
jgi:cation transport regulator ChaC